jgi:hypothetical protein
MMNDPLIPEKDTYEINKKHLIWGIVLYGVIMWTSGFIWARMVIP